MGKRKSLGLDLGSNSIGWVLAEWKEVLSIVNGKNQKAVENPDGLYPIYGSGGVMSYADDYLCPENTTIVGRKGTINKPILVREKFWNVDTAFGLVAGDKLDSFYLNYFCQLFDFFTLNKSTTLPSLAKRDLKEIQIPLPPLPEQERIVAKLDGLFEKIDQAIGLLEENIAHTEALMGSVLDEELSGLNYELSDWELKTWNDVVEIKNGKNQKKVENSGGKYPIYGSGGVMNYADDYLCEKNSVIVGRKGTINKPIYVDTKFWNVDTAFGLTPKADLLPRYLFFFCIHFNFMTLNKSTTLPSLAKRDLLKIQINLPPINIQKRILLKIEGVNSFKNKVTETQTQKLHHLKALKSSLLDQAFKGEL